MDEVVHTGTGQFSWLTMRPMSLYESGDSNGTISLLDLFDSSKKISGTNNLELEDIAHLCFIVDVQEVFLWIKKLL